MLAVLAFFLSAPVPALESDQYYAWGCEIEDATIVLNAKFNLEIAKALKEVNRQNRRHPASSDEVTRAVQQRLKFFIFQPIELWAINTPCLARVPATREEEFTYRKTNLYHRRGLFDLSGWIPNVPTIEADGIRFGTDKLAHFVSAGWRCYRCYRRKVKKGMLPEKAEETAMRRAILGENAILGTWTTGVFSLADLEANYQGMKFYQSLCSGDNPILEYRDGQWQQRRTFDIRDHLTPEWDESYESSIFTKSRWRRVSPILEQYRNRLALPQVAEQRRRYRLRDRQTLTETLLAEAISQKKLKDPRLFSLEPDTPDLFTPRMQIEAKKRVPDHLPLDEHRLQEIVKLLEEENSQRTRVPSLVLGAHLSNPEVLAASLSYLDASLPTSYNGRSLTIFEGPLAQMVLGLNGGRLALGWGRVFGEKRFGSLFLSDVFLGYAVKGALLQTWTDPLGADPDRTFLGLEGEASIVRVNFRLGLFHILENSEQADPWLATVGIGYGF